MVHFNYAVAARCAAVLLLCAGLIGSADVRAQSLQADGDAILLVDDGAWMQPKWSPDGTRLAITQPRYEGITLVDVPSGAVQQLTDEAGAGYGFAWSESGDAIVARVTRVEGRSRSHAVKLFDLAAGEERALTDYRPHMATTPQWADGEASVALMTPSGEVERVATGRATVASKAAMPVLAPASDGIRLVRSSDRSEVVRSFDGRDVINVTPSPDGSRVAFEIVGGNLMVMDANGGNVRDLGVGYRPTWSPDGRWVAFMVSEDDGHSFTASDIYAALADGSERVQLTSTRDRLEMNPSWSPDGRHIAFDDVATGSIYLLPVRY